ncbi:Uncharacterised protein [Acetobacterium wieringae]|uniref:peptidoglycan DD-metalloendopeptidase family protein n=1 Tax=Acetobacterium wieringae TaxID=52694 RepID=UPI001D2F3B63|nr:peptidoglycan DD-metalloendopeptidase family protein [Acetobacterium wieringae]VUZ27852.1 Uncharacterised protein [Acetobacterium wieringae]
MVYDIGLKIGIEGEAEYRKSIRDINTENKTLKTEMESVTSAFDKNDKSQQNLTKQNEILTRQIELQRKKIQESQVILEKSTAEYGESDRKTQSWKQTINGATTELNKLERQLKENNNALDSSDKKIDSLAKSTDLVSTGFGALKVGFAAGIGAVTAVGYAIGNVIEGMNDMEDQTAQMNAVLKSTGGVSGMTTNEMIKMADAMEDTTKFAAEQTMEAENLLLTFTNIGEDVFPTATETLLDMATAMGTDAKGGAIQLGKALNDPTEGISALTRVGVTFTEEQKELIKSLQDSGDMAGAQTVILQELQKEFGGSAKAAGETFSGQLAILNNSIGETSEELLITLMPTLQEFVEDINDNMPKIKELATAVGEDFEEGAETFKVAFDEIKQKVEENAPAMRSSFEGVKESWGKFFDDVVGDNKTLQNMDWESVGTGISNVAIVMGNVAQTAGTFADLILAPFILVREFIDDVFSGLIEGDGDLSGFSERLVGMGITWQNAFIDVHNTIASVFNMLGSDVPMWTRVSVEGATENIEAETPNIKTAAQKLHDGIVTPMVPMPEEMRRAGLNGSMKLGEGIGSGTPWALINAQNLHDGVKGANDPLTGELGQIGSGSVTSMGAGINLSAPIVNAAAAGIYGTVTGNLSPLGGFGTKTGEEVNAGLRSGMEDKPAIELSVGGIVNWVLDAFNVGFDIHSPAKKMHPIGVNVLQGLFTGMNSLDIGAFADSMVQRLLDAFNNGKVTALGIFNSMGEMGAALLEKMGISLGVTGGGLPVQGDITSYFGNRDDVPEYASKWHAGIDIAAAEGTPIYAVESGTASLSTGTGYGNLVIIDNGAGLQEYYGHMSGFAISDGQVVKKGDIIGYVGSTGNSTGPHLHFGVMQNGEWIDPLTLYGGYATGTNWASPGLHWVGERGPELINFRGGESVFTASESRKIANQRAAEPKIIERQPVNLQLTLNDGRVLAEYLIDDINRLLGIKTGIASRGVA